MLTKCLWKMFGCGDDVRGQAKRPSCHSVLEAATRAIETIPDRRDNRHLEKEPILEPHYKLVSLVHKLVQRGQLQATEACSSLQATLYARKVPTIEDRSEWDTYVTQVLKALRSADKSNWHHRMAARVCSLNVYNDRPRLT